MPSIPKVPERTRPSFALSILQRALIDCLGRRQFGKKEIVEYSLFFGENTFECVYCGSKDIARWDHLVPIKRGGETILGNMVIACAACDDTKRHLTLEEWMTNAERWSLVERGVKDLPQRFQKLIDYMQFFKYTPEPLDQRLSSMEQEKFRAIQDKIADLQKDIDELLLLRSVDRKK